MPHLYCDSRCSSGSVERIRFFGVSINDHDPANSLRLIDTGVVDSVQVIYNVFDQSPQDELFPRAISDGVGVLARVPFDEGSLTGTLTADATWPKGDWRNLYFTPATIADEMERWLFEEGCDGFNIMFPYVPEGLDDFVDKVVPELQRRGLFRREYEGKTLRENLGLPRPENQFFSSSKALAGERTDVAR